jgi:hypothetical protein
MQFSRKRSVWLFASLMSAAFVACDDDDKEEPQAITTEEAAVMASSSLASNSSGIAFASKESADGAEDVMNDHESGRAQACGVSQNIDLSGSSPIGSSIAWSYDFSYKFRLNCAEEAPKSISVDLSYNGSYDGPRAAFEHSGVSQVEVTGLAESDADFILDGTYKRSGSFTIKEGDQKAGSSSVDYTLTAINVDKDGHDIVSGTAKFVLKGSVTGKGTFNYEGNVTFQGSDKAELKIKSETYVVNLVNGELTKK